MKRTSQSSQLTVLMVSVASLALLAGSSAATTLSVPVGHPTIQAAVEAAATGDTVMIAPGTYTSCVTRDPQGTLNAVLIVEKDLTLTAGPGNGRVVVDPDRVGRGLYVESARVTLRGLVIVNGAPQGTEPHGDAGGGLRAVSAEIFARDCEFRDNTASDGGAVLATASYLNLERCAIRNNAARSLGGGLALRNRSHARLASCRIAFNSAARGGGLAVVDRSVMRDDGGSYLFNDATERGGALHAAGGSQVWYCQSKLAGNSAGTGREGNVESGSFGSVNDSSWNAGEWTGLPLTVVMNRGCTDLIASASASASAGEDGGAPSGSATGDAADSQP